MADKAWLRFFSEGVLTLISRSQEYGSEEEAGTGHAIFTCKTASKKVITLKTMSGLSPDP